MQVLIEEKKKNNYSYKSDIVGKIGGLKNPKNEK